jgi:hypothetical protein
MNYKKRVFEIYVQYINNNNAFHPVLAARDKCQRNGASLFIDWHLVHSTRIFGRAMVLFKWKSSHAKLFISYAKFIIFIHWI